MLPREVELVLEGTGLPGCGAEGVGGGWGGAKELGSAV